MTKNKKLSFCEMFGSFGIVIIIFGFMAGIVITAIGGNWELMKESPKIMVIFQIDQLIMWTGLLLVMGSAAAWNIIDKKPR